MEQMSTTELDGKHYERGECTRVYTRPDSSKHIEVAIYELSCRWDNDTAQYVYQLKQKTWVYPSIEAYKTGDYSENLVTSTWAGDKEWAERIAYHYGISMPSEIDYNVAPGVSLKELGLEE